jgi:hypothetical protein
MHSASPANAGRHFEQQIAQIGFWNRVVPDVRTRRMTAVTDTSCRRRGTHRRRGNQAPRRLNIAPAPDSQLSNRISGFAMVST